MDVKAGYKQTDVGVIPEEWEVKKLGEIGEALIGLTYSPTDVKSYGTLVLRSSNIQKDKLAFDDNVFVDVEIPDRILVRSGDVLICVRNGSRDLIGKTTLLDNRAEGMTFGAFMAVYRSSAGKLVNFLFQSMVLKHQIREHLGATINQITNKSLNSFLIPYPPSKVEQDAITNALSDCDAFIEVLEALLVKKRKIKQGVMQELLTGKMRVMDYGEWRVQRLGDVLTLRYGKSQKGIISVGGKYPIIATSGEVGRTNQYLYDKPSVIIGRKGTIDSPRYIETPFWTIDTAYYSEIFEHANPKFLYYLLTAIDWYSYNEASGVPSLNAKTVESIEVSLPELSEQTAIAEILSDMDAEIATLESKLAKARQVKQGMMQELLTGRIRLI